MCASRRHLALPFLALLFSVLLLGSLGPRAAHADAQRRISLRVGEQISVSASNIAKYSEGQPGIVDIRLPEDAEQFIVVGLKPGTSTLLLIRESGSKLTYSFEVKAQTNEVPRKANIRLDFYFVELKKGSQYQVGINWPGSVGVDMALEVGLDSGGITGASASLSGLPLPRLDLLERGDWARIARQASIITSNGEEALFDSGGEVNIAIEGSQAAELRQIPFGTKVKVLPRYDLESGRLELRINAEVSSLGEGRVPTRSRSRIATVVNLEINQAIVLAGLHSQDESKSRSGLPFFSQLPIIGTLFGSHGARSEEVQNVVFIVPSIVDVVRMDAHAQIRDALSAYQHFSGDLGAVDISPSARTPSRSRKGGR